MAEQNCTDMGLLDSLCFCHSIMLRPDLSYHPFGSQGSEQYLCNLMRPNFNAIIYVYMYMLAQYMMPYIILYL